MEQNTNNIIVGDREKKMIQIAKIMTDEEIFGMRCFIAGMKIEKIPTEKPHEPVQAE